MWPILQLSNEIAQLWIFYYLIFLFLAMRETDFACHVAGNTPGQSYSGPYISRIFPHWDWIRRDTTNKDTFYAMKVSASCRIFLFTDLQKRCILMNLFLTH